MKLDEKQVSRLAKYYKKRLGVSASFAEETAREHLQPACIERVNFMLARVEHINKLLRVLGADAKELGLDVEKFPPSYRQGVVCFQGTEDFCRVRLHNIAIAQGREAKK